MMKLLWVILSFAILLAGCYSTMPFSTNALAPDDKGAFFRLHDNSCIESDAGDHLRIEDGYKIKGELVKGDFYKDFEGVVRDNQIKEIAVKEFDTGLTVFAVLLAASIPVWFVIKFYTGGWD